MIKKNISIYVHWPFCISKCPYCDFNSHIKREIDSNEWGLALTTELNFLFKKYFKGKESHTLKSIFFGGGTPSLMDPAIVEKIINKSKCLFNQNKDENVEISLEANPGSIFKDKLKDFFDSGINRISIGVQSFDKNDLRFLGRDHSVYDAKRAIELSRNIFKNLSFDLIYALPEQSVESWESSLNEAFQFEPDHLSLYQLTIENGTAFNRLYRSGKLFPIKDDLASDMYLVTDRITKDNHLPAYEISNHSKIYKKCDHNLAYWRGGDWIGIGPGATSRFSYGKKRLQVDIRKDPTGWINGVRNKKNGIKRIIDETNKDYLIEKVIMGLRLVDGINFDEVSSVLDINAVNKLIDSEYITCDKNVLSATFNGRLRLNSIISEVIK